MISEPAVDALLAQVCITCEAAVDGFRSVTQIARLLPLDRAVAQYELATREAEERLTRLRTMALRRMAASQTKVLAESLEHEHVPLTPREREVAVLIARGYSNRQIADALVIGPGTAANHVAHILEKLNCVNRAQVAVWAVGLGLVTDGVSVSSALPIEQESTAKD